MSDRQCAVCMVGHGFTTAVTRYSLKRQWREGGVHHNRAAGGLDLCATCWERLAKPRMKPRMEVRR